MKTIRFFFDQIKGMLLLFIAFLLLFLALFYYISINVEMTLLDRKLNRLGRKKELLEKKNRALRSAINQISGEKLINGYLASSIPVQNRVVRIKFNSHDK